MPSGSTTDAVYNGEKPPNSNTTTPDTGDDENLESVRLAAFMAAPPSTVVASDLTPRDIYEGHKSRIAAELKNIASGLPRA
ncbi:hypothetical protein F5Y05DRAFT_412478 [Hypoxylon sp. FL0543]|nr:hypothetical protein F5Y05DRAFT_412478 [Hypoxylon sp. FL0543]